MPRANWGGNWRMPKSSEMEELINECSWTWSSQDGVNGYIVTGPNGNSIFIPAGGYRKSSQSEDTNIYGNYWSSTPNTITEAYRLNIGKNKKDIMTSSRHYGRNIRPVIE